MIFTGWLRHMNFTFYGVHVLMDHWKERIWFSSKLPRRHAGWISAGSVSL